MKTEKEVKSHLKTIEEKLRDKKLELKELSKMEFIGKSEAERKTIKIIESFTAKVDTLRFILELNEKK